MCPVTLLRHDTSNDDYGGEKTQPVEVVEVHVAISEETGARKEWFKTIGYNRPVAVRMYKVSQEWDAIRWQNEVIVVKSKVEDEDNSLILNITGDITTVRI